MTTYKNEKEAIDGLLAKYKQLSSEIKKIIIGQDVVIRSVLTSVFSKGHCLLIGVPGLAKTLLIKTIADALDLKFSRIQFTPDLMPSDITGSEILDESKHFRFVKGPVFANIVLADEINRTPPKTQSALLEAMQEKNVTVAGQFHKLQEPFFVLATQNPIEQEGTYPLPEAQLDRFMFNVILDYPSYEDEINIVKETTSGKNIKINKIISAEEIIYFQNLLEKIPVPDNVIEYAVSLVNKTRPNTKHATPKINEYIAWGAGPRASQYLIIGAKTNAVLKGKYSPDIEDVQEVAYQVLRHRIVKNYKAEAEGIPVEDIIKELF
ncbi:MAG: AAA family ATPase [Bacteroidetes bacterium]|jgi:MoxR-like ATPase|nr:AAA family ATPase [Bacteroidota bacterium]MBT5530089.1 AAA family ATPase [Cytophagia bacterium]MBT3422196.1 AAA family ATPase [Bacteroidota bacterium]MBT3801297.1 AAA family ATPase [Bacteroidota bacterium]MBT3934923.1 AAA family ATPase [Bacteroidota bacterium]